jgi:hypothetical protein
MGDPVDFPSALKESSDLRSTIRWVIDFAQAVMSASHRNVIQNVGASGAVLSSINNALANQFPLFTGPTAVALSTLFQLITPSDFSVASSTTLTDIPGLSATLQAGVTYEFEVRLFVSSGASTGGLKTAIGGTVVASHVVYDGFALDTGGTPVEGYAQASALGTAVSNTNTSSSSTTVVMSGSIVVTTGGTLTVQAAQRTSNATPTVFGQGSYFNVRSAA